MDQNGTIDFPFPAEQSDPVNVYNSASYRLSGADRCALLDLVERERLRRLIESQIFETNQAAFAFMEQLSADYTDRLPQFVLSVYPFLLTYGMPVRVWLNLLKATVKCELDKREHRLLINLAYTSLIETSRHYDLHLLKDEAKVSPEVLRLALVHRTSVTAIRSLFDSDLLFVQAMIQCFDEQITASDLNEFDIVTVNFIVYEMPAVWKSNRHKFIYALCRSPYFNRQQVCGLLDQSDDNEFKCVVQLAVQMIAEAEDPWKALVRLISSLPRDRLYEGLRVAQFVLDNSIFKAPPKKLLLLSVALAVDHCHTEIENPFASEPSCATLLQLARLNNVQSNQSA